VYRYIIFYVIKFWKLPVYYNFLNVSKLSIGLIFCTASLSVVGAQKPETIDSLLNVVKNGVDEKSTIEAKVELSWEYLDVDNRKSLDYSSDAFELAIQFGDSAQMVRAGRIKGQALRRFDRLQESIEVLGVVLPIAKRHSLKDEYKKILNGLAVAHTFKAEYDKALEYNFQSLILREAEGNKAEISITLNNIGLVYFKLNNFDGALKYYNRCLSFKEEVGDTTDLHKLYINLGLSYLHIENFKEAKTFMLRGLSICNDKCDDEIMIMGELGLGESSLRLGDLAEAEEHLNKTLGIARRLGQKRWQAESLTFLGVVAIKRKEFETAITFLNEADLIANSAGYNQSLIEIYKHFSDIYNQIEDYKNAAFYQKKYIQLSDSLIGQDLVKNIGKIQADYEERENIATIADRDFRLNQQRKLNIAWVVIAFMAGLLVLVLQFGNRNIKRFKMGSLRTRTVSLISK